VGKRARKSSSDANSMLQLRSAQRIVTEQTHELDALRARTLKRVLTEERSRYARLMAGVLDAFKVQIRQYQRVSATPASPPPLECAFNDVVLVS
jgi:hypothetical protein